MPIINLDEEPYFGVLMAWSRNRRLQGAARNRLALLQLTAELISLHLRANQVPAGDLAALISAMFGAVATLTENAGGWPSNGNFPRFHRRPKIFSASRAIVGARRRLAMRRR